MIKSLQDKLMQSQKKQEEMQTMEIEGAAGNGLVKVKGLVSGKIISIHIDDSIYSDREMVEDLIVAAINDLRAKAKRMVEENDDTASALPTDMNGILNMINKMR